MWSNFLNTRAKSNSINKLLYPYKKKWNNIKNNVFRLLKTSKKKLLKGDSSEKIAIDFKHSLVWKIIHIQHIGYMCIIMPFDSDPLLTQTENFYGFIVHIPIIYNINPLLFVNDIVSGSTWSFFSYFKNDWTQKKNQM